MKTVFRAAVFAAALWMLAACTPPAGQNASVEPTAKPAVLTEATAAPIESAEAKVKVRGNYTSTYPKRPLSIKFSEKQARCAG